MFCGRAETFSQGGPGIEKGSLCPLCTRHSFKRFLGGVVDLSFHLNGLFVRDFASTQPIANNSVCVRCCAMLGDRLAEICELVQRRPEGSHNPHYEQGRRMRGKRPLASRCCCKGCQGSSKPNDDHDDQLRRFQAIRLAKMPCLCFFNITKQSVGVRMIHRFQTKKWAHDSLGSRRPVTKWKPSGRSPAGPLLAEIDRRCSRSDRIVLVDV